MNTQISPTELQRYAEELFRRAIASTLEIPRHVLTKSPDKKALVDHCLSSVIAIGTHSTLEAAATQFVTSLGVAGKEMAMADALKHIGAIYEKFPLPIAGVERMIEMKAQGILSKEIWAFLRSMVRIDSEYDDSWILRGEEGLRELDITDALSGAFSNDLIADYLIAIKDMEEPGDIVWKVIIDSAKKRFDYSAFEKGFADFDNDNLAEDILFLTIGGLAEGGSVDDIAAKINQEFLLDGLSFGDDQLPRFISQRNLDLFREVKAMKTAESLSETGAQTLEIFAMMKNLLNKSN